MKNNMNKQYMKSRERLRNIVEISERIWNASLLLLVDCVIMRKQKAYCYIAGGLLAVDLDYFIDKSQSKGVCDDVHKNFFSSEPQFFSQMECISGIFSTWM